MVLRIYERLEALFDVSRGKPTLQALAGLRGFAVLLVFGTHYVALIRPWMNPETLTYRFGSAVALIGHSGVDLFFVLSGYLIYGALIARPVRLGDFLRRRVHRIYPTFACVLALYVILAMVFPQTRKLPAGWDHRASYLVENALLLPGIFPITPLITVSWSLSYEAFFYLAAPMLVWGLRLREQTRQSRITLLTAFTAAAFLAMPWVAPGHIRLVMFIAGMLLFERMSGEPSARRRPWGIAAGVFAVALMLIIPVSGLHAMWRYVVLYACFFVLGADALRSQTLTARLLSLAPLRWLGNMSYSYYLIHGLTVNAGFFVLKSFVSPAEQSDTLFWVALLPMLALTLTTGTLLFVVIEKPLSFERTRRSQTASTAEIDYVGGFQTAR